MSSRALKKLAKAEQIPENDSDDDWAPVQKQSVFSLIDLRNSSEENLSNTQDEYLQKPPSFYKSNKKNKRNQKKNAKKAVEALKSMEDEDELLEQAQQLHASTSVEKSYAEYDLLSINRKWLDYLAELQRKFGVGATGHLVAKDDIRGGRNVFGQLVRGPKANWPPLTKCGLDMTLKDGKFSFTHNKEYSRQQKAFYALQDTIDPNTLSMLLSRAPYHVDTLLQLSEYLMHQDSSEVGVDMLERALYAMQSSFEMSFNFSSTNNCQLDYRIQENRSLFIALFRYIFYVASRSCYRSALEYSKILLMLDPDNDPLAIILAIDFFCIASDEHEFLIKLYEEWNPKRNLNMLPNFAFSIPLVHWLQCFRCKRKRPSVSTLTSDEIDKLLQDALLMFPGFLPRLMKHTRVGGTDNLDKSVLFGKEVRLSESESLGRLLDVYVAQAYYYWQEPDVLAWLEKNIEQVLLLVEPIVVSIEGDASIEINRKSFLNRDPDPRLHEYSAKRKRIFTTAPRNVLRHIFLLELPEARPLLPPNFGSQRIYQLDPFPPIDSINSYNPEAERRNVGHGSSAASFLNTLFATMWPTVPNENVGDLNAILADFGLRVEVVENQETGDGEEQPPEEFD